MKKQKISCVVLAAGKGTRMKSEKAKVLHEVFFAPMIHHVLDAVTEQRIDKTIVVVGHQRDRVKEALKRYPVAFVVQKEQLGTGHAVLSAEGMIEKDCSTVLVLCGDTPLIRATTLANMLKEHHATQGVLSVMTTNLVNPANYGRIVCDKDGHIARIVEEKDATLEQKKINEINAGIYCAEATFLFDALKRVGNDNSQGEIYLTDIVELAIQAGHPVNRFAGVDAEEVLGVNSRVELAAAHKYLQKAYNQKLMFAGVTLLEPESIFIQKTVTIGRDTCVHANVHITGQTTIGSQCNIYPNTVIQNCVVGNNVTVGPFAYLDNQIIEDGKVVQPQLASKSF